MRCKSSFCTYLSALTIAESLQTHTARIVKGISGEGSAGHFIDKLAVRISLREVLKQSGKVHVPCRRVDALRFEAFILDGGHMKQSRILDVHPPGCAAQSAE